MPQKRVETGDQRGRHRPLRDRHWAKLNQLDNVRQSNSTARKPSRRQLFVAHRRRAQHAKKGSRDMTTAEQPAGSTMPDKRNFWELQACRNCIL